MWLYEFKHPVILVAVHKPALLPFESCFATVHAGACESRYTDIARFRDDEGDNISAKNAFYCELTALYWFWKNCHAPHVGLCHYRRYFAAPGTNLIATCDDLNFLEDVDVVVPKARSYYFISVKSQFCARFGIGYWNLLEKVIDSRTAVVRDAFEKVARHNHLHLYNMFIMRWELFDEYMDWLFSILRELEELLDLEHHGQEHQRILGHFSERLLNVWLDTKRDSLSIRTLSVVNTEGQSDLRKATSLLFDLAKFHIKGRSSKV